VEEGIVWTEIDRAALGQVAEALVLVHVTGRCPQPGPAGSQSGQHVAGVLASSDTNRTISRRILRARPMIALPE
jgi:hypothetical protein